MEKRPIRPIDFLRPLGFPKNWMNSLLLSQNIHDPDYLPKSDPSSLFSLWTAISSTATQFLSLWKKEYLLSLRERYKKLPNSSGRWPSEGEIVIVFDPNLPKSLWKIALIEKVHFNESSLPDTATVKFHGTNHNSIRAISHLFPLETTDEIKNRIPPFPPIAITQADKSETTKSQSFSQVDKSPNILKLRSRTIFRQ